MKHINYSLKGAVISLENENTHKVILRKKYEINGQEIAKYNI
jgi:hypothetical protein